MCGLAQMLLYLSKSVLPAKHAAIKNVIKKIGATVIVNVLNFKQLIFEGQGKHYIENAHNCLCNK